MNRLTIVLIILLVASELTAAQNSDYSDCRKAQYEWWMGTFSIAGQRALYQLAYHEGLCFLNQDGSVIDPKYETDEAILRYQLRECGHEELTRWREELQVLWELPIAERDSDMTSLYMLDSLEEILNAPQPPICEPAMTTYLTILNAQSYLMLSFLGVLGADGEDISAARAERIDRYTRAIDILITAAELGIDPAISETLVDSR